ncbi:hypothetical protein ACFQLX_24625 [Streptomyces polyrhachis]|uniref:Uncharacterized protein n=1 Tax=Streptomyces polyrhachis TaxID=1282885 RepID=A0ABW2GQT1_9ACTN
MTSINEPRVAAVKVDVNWRTIQAGDVLIICGQPFEVLNLIDLSGRGRALRFTSGKVLNINSYTRLTVTRAVRKW